MTVHIVVAQPRSGGTMVAQVIQAYYGCEILYECFNTHRYGIGDYADAYAFKTNMIEELSNRTDDVVIKISRFDAIEIIDQLIDLSATWTVVVRTSPLEMVISSYLSHITGVYHKGDMGIYPIENVDIPISFVHEFFDVNNAGGWFYNIPTNNDLLRGIDFTMVNYTDATTPDIVSNLLFDQPTGGPIGVEKLYPNKTKLVNNYDAIAFEVDKLNGYI